VYKDAVVALQARRLIAALSMTTEAIFADIRRHPAPSTRIGHGS